MRTAPIQRVPQVSARGARAPGAEPSGLGGAGSGRPVEPAPDRSTEKEAAKAPATRCRTAEHARHGPHDDQGRHPGAALPPVHGRDRVGLVRQAAPGGPSTVRIEEPGAAGDSGREAIQASRRKAPVARARRLLRERRRRLRRGGSGSGHFWERFQPRPQHGLPAGQPGRGRAPGESPGAEGQVRARAQDREVPAEPHPAGLVHAVQEAEGRIHPQARKRR